MVYKEKKPYISLKAIAYHLDGKIHSLNCAIKKKCDIMVVMERNSGRREMLEWFLKHGKPSGWGSLLYQVPDSNGINELDKAIMYADSPIDKFLVPETSNYNVYKIYGKPVVYYKTPYDFSHHKELQNTPKKNMIAIQAGSPSDLELNFMHLLHIVKNTKANSKLLTRTNEDEARTIINKLGLSNRIEVKCGWMDREDYLKYISDCKVILSLESRPMIGHTQLDAICTGAYSVGWEHSPVQKLAYPSFGCNPYNLEDAIEKTKMALDMPDYKPSSEVIEYFNPDKIIEYINEMWIK